jgi:hypothetical protein
LADLDKFYHCVARLTVQAFHFYKNPSKKLPTFMLTRMYSSACAVLRTIDRLDSSGIIRLNASPFYFIYATSLASFTILRLLKASTAQYMDENAKEAFFLGVNVMKRLSTENSDGPSRMALILTQLWNSEKAFKNADGSEHLCLRIRTRLAMSTVFDSIWWWREEFGGQPGAYTSLDESTKVEPKGTTSQLLSKMLTSAGLGLQEEPSLEGSQDFLPMIQPNQVQDMTSFLDDHLLAELGWTNSNFIYPPAISTTATAPYNTEWFSPTELNGFAI